MAGTNVGAHDEMVRRLEQELEERSTFASGIVERANASKRDLSEEEKGLLSDTRSRMEVINDQLTDLEDINKVATQVRDRVRVVDKGIMNSRGRTYASGDEVSYATAGAYALDVRNAALGDREAHERLEVYYRAAAHQKTTDNPGTVPDPVVGEVINFIDAARPMVQALGPRPMPSATWSRPKVTGHTAVGRQGTNGALGADEKTELPSQKMTISRLTASAVTYGGYVNVSRQDIDFSTPSALDIVVNDLASQYAIETEAALGDAFSAVSTPAVHFDPTDPAGLAVAIWAAAAKVFTAVRGQGRLQLFISPDMLAAFGPLFAPYGPQNQFGQGFNPVTFGQGPMGVISGVPTSMSAGLATGEAFLTSTAAVEVYEQRVGTLQVVEPSVMGVQVAYAGYFTPMTIEAGGVVPLVGDGS